MALTVTLVPEVTTGAVKSPDVEMDPALADQVTAVFVEPLTVAVNCWVAPEETAAVAGEIEIDTALGGLTVMVAEADMAVLARLVACTVTFILDVQLGAVNCPEGEIEPALALQVTASL